MKGSLYKYFNKLFLKQWVIGVARADLKNIIRNKSFEQNIKWLPVSTIDHFYADPFLLKGENGNIQILYEDFDFEEFYGKLAVMNLDENLDPVNEKLLLDTKSHLSYPFIFREAGKTYIFPEASHSGKLSCYEYNETDQSFTFVKDILELPLLDSSILKHNGKFWLFGTIKGDYSHSRLNIFFSDNLLGPYTPHPGNPVKNSADGSRPAGNFIEVDNVIYRPAQNCSNIYGESITINRIEVLDEVQFEETAYMEIKIDRNIHDNSRVHAIHTINAVDNIITVDGIKWTFSPADQWTTFFRNKRILKMQRQ